VENYDAFVYTVAIGEDNEEYIRAKERNIPIISRADYMGYLMTEYETRIGVSGMHGKSTVTSMCASLLMSADTDPTVLSGAELDLMGGAYRVGKKDFFLFEACEYMDSFLDFYPTTAVILNTELDHVDYFENLERMCRSYAAFGSKVGQDGTVIYNADDSVCAATVQACEGRRVSFGIEADADYRAADIRTESGRQSFSLYVRGQNKGRISLKVPGRHNVYNASRGFAEDTGIYNKVSRIKRTWI
jgi:UDP-N-acetylmuramate--alanine ligase